MNSYLDNYLWQINKYQKLTSYCNNTVNFFEGVEDKHGLFNFYCDFD